MVSVMSKWKLENLEWKDFKVQELFDVTLSAGDNQLKKLENGATPLISAGINNNGVTGFIKNGDGKSQLFKKNLISVDMFGQAFTHSYEFYAVSHGRINILLPKFNTNGLINQFIINSINLSVKNKFSYNVMCSSERLLECKLLLPTDSKGNPNWEFMENYIKQEQNKQSEKIKKYYSEKMTKLSEENLTLEDVDWKEFWIEDICEIKSGVRLTKANMRLGNRPFIGATENDNGITNFVDNTNASINSNVLGVNYNGSVVKSFYHEYECIFSDDVKQLEIKNPSYRNKYSYLFLKQVILQQETKYTYGYKFNATRMKRQKIMLPIDKKSEPHWQYMNTYMKLQELKLIRRLLKNM